MNAQKPNFHLLTSKTKLRLVDEAVMRYATFFNLGAFHPLFRSGKIPLDWFRALIVNSERQSPWIPIFLEFCDFQVHGTEVISKFLTETYVRNFFPLSQEDRSSIQAETVKVV